jgi:uncharacterized protein
MFKPSSYQPRFTGGHKQTLFAWARPRQFPRLPAPVERYFDVAADARVLAHCHFRGENVGTAPTLVLLHGLEGSSMAHYMRGIADKAWAAGWDVVRLNQRNCGGTERLSRGLYHSGLTHDVRHVVYELLERDGVPAVAVSGYSLGGNLALKLAGNGPGHLRGGARAAIELSVRVELRPQSQGSDAEEVGCVSGSIFARPVASHMDRATVRRRVHGAASRVC